MPVIRGGESERDAILEVARLMLVSARTAPKSGGVDDISTAIVYGAEKESLVAEMKRIGEERNIKGFRRDAINVRDS
ncbi:ferredoxin, partial [Candidatus Bathyarchaeota archaeon]|nr:ferredoxin [Candidatus Bathyarchaeota archaeon]